MQISSSSRSMLVNESRRKYVELRSQLVDERFKLDDLLADEEIRAPEIGASWGRIAEIKVEMLGLVARFFNEAGGPDSRPLPENEHPKELLKVEQPELEKIPTGRRPGGGSNWKCTWVGETSKTMAFVCTNLDDDSEWQIRYKDGDRQTFRSPPLS